MKNSKYILVTGGEGFIGRSICNHLYLKGKKIVSIDNLSNSKRNSSNKNIIFYKIDLKNKKKLEKIFKIYNFETIIHLAAKINARESNIKKKEYFLNNYSYGKNLIEIAKKHMVKYFIFASSAAVYGSYKTHFKENDKKKPINAYGKYKLLFENLLQKSKIRHANLRFFNICGANLKTNSGQRNNNGVIKKLCRVGFKNKIFNFYGNNFSTEDGYSVRDYLHIDDLNNIIFKSINYLKNKKKCLTMNCGSGKGTSTKKLVDTYSFITRRNIDTRVKKKISGEPAEVISKINVLKKIFKYSPKYSDLKNIIKTSIKWEEFINLDKKTK
jgi:UDP-glucose 4-epimerase